MLMLFAHTSTSMSGELLYVLFSTQCLAAISILVMNVVLQALYWNPLDLSVTIRVLLSCRLADWLW
jgi:hypothetical protein